MSILKSEEKVKSELHINMHENIHEKWTHTFKNDNSSINRYLTINLPKDVDNLDEMPIL